VLVLWGPQWTASVALVLALVPVAAIQPVNAVNGALFLARDDAGLLLRVTGLNAAAVLAGMAAGLPWGAAGVAWGYSAAYVLFAAPHAMLTAQHRVLAGTTRELAGWLARPVAAGAAVLVCGGAVAALLPAETSPLVALAALVAASLVGLAAAVRLAAWPLVAPLLSRGATPAVASAE
jgi:PST family polysaccharide transporter